MPAVPVRHLGILLPVLLLASGAAAGQAPRSPVLPAPGAAAGYVAENWSTEEGLPHNTVTSITQTPDGYLWLGTLGGLARFDGVSFRVFNQRTGKGPANSRIRVLYTDREGRLWIGAESGAITRYAGGEFVEYAREAAGQADTVLAISEGPEGGLWVGTTAGLFRQKGNTFSRVPLSEHPDETTVTALYQDRLGRLWIGTNAQGIARYDGARFTWHDAANGLPERAVLSIEEGPDGSLLVGTDGGGLVRLDGARFVPAAGLSARDPISRVFDLGSDRYGHLWLATGTGLGRVSEAGFEFFTSGSDLTREPIHTHYVDAHNNVWLGTDRGLTGLREERFHVVTQADGLGAPTALAVYGDRAGDLWIGTQCGGLNRLRNGLLEAPLSPGRLDQSCVWSLLEDRDGALWAGTQTGLHRVDASGVTHLTTTSGLPDNFVLALLEDRSGALWIGTRNGLARYRNGTFDVYSARDGLGSNWIRAILEDRQGALWIATDAGLTRFANNTFRTFTTAEGLGSGDVRTLYEDAEGVLWIGTLDGGLSRYVNDRFATFTARDGLAENRISAILEDDTGHLWMCGNRGVQRVSKHLLNARADGSPAPLVAYLYSQSDGLLNPTCTGGFQPSAWADREGRLWFPTFGGVATIDPALQSNEFTLPSVLIEGVEAGDAWFEGTEIRLPRGLRDLVIHYTSPTLRSAEHVQFRFRMEGLDDAWVEAGDRRRAFYRNIDPGEYTFLVRASLDGGTWHEAVTSVRVPAYFHETGWFWALMGFALVAVAATLFQFNVRRLGKRAEALRLLVDERTNALQSEMQKSEASRQQAETALEEAEHQRIRAEAALATIEEQAETLRQVDELKSRFFANISHEFRTPLSLVIDPLENALRGDYGSLDEAFKRRLKTALRNTRLVLRLINQLLDLARIETGGMQLSVAQADLVAFLRGIVQLFQSEAERRHVGLHFTPATPALQVYFDRDKLEKIVFNLISNALKATPAGGKILVSVAPPGTTDDQTKDPEEGFVAISVRDTGLGIPPDKLPFIFDRFYQVDTPSTGHHTGTGIGLALVRELTALHRGRIDVESVPGFGSVFSLALPLGRGRYEEHEILERPVSSTPLQVEARLADVLADASNATSRQEGDPSDAAAAAPSDADESDRPLILVVEDNPDVREMLRDHLSAGYRVAEAENGLEGLEAARRLRPDLILSDIIMPAMEGIAFCRMLKQDSRLRDVPVVLLTARASDESRLEGLSVGADDYVTKPFNKRELLTRVENLIRTRRALREQFSQEIVLQPRGVVVPSEDGAFIERVRGVVEQHLEDPLFSVGALASAVGLSESQLGRRMHAILGRPPVAFIRDFRLERAAQLLRQRAGNVSEVAFAVGFQNPPYFAKCFRERFGVSPSQFSDPASTPPEQEFPE